MLYVSSQLVDEAGIQAAGNAARACARHPDEDQRSRWPMTHLDAVVSAC